MINFALIAFGMITQFVISPSALMLNSALAESKNALTPKIQWTTQMRSLDHSLSQILFLTTQNDSLDSKEIRTAVLKEATNIRKLASELAVLHSQIDPDPSVKILAEVFSEETKHAEESFRLGHREYARRIFRSLPTYCVACHSRDASGPQFNLNTTDPRANRLKGIVKADYLAATRRFNEAIQSFESLINDNAFFNKHPMSWQRAVQSAVTIAVRVNHSPDETSRIIELALKQSKAPMYFRGQLTKWLESVNSWKLEKKSEPTSEAGLFAHAVMLFNAAKESQRFPADRSGDVNYLRSTSVLHELLRKFPKGTKTPEALFLAGLSYEVLKDPALGNLHEYFYLTCIHQYPNTSQAQDCFHRYEESVHLGYSGSGGENLPEDILKRLEELKKISSTESPSVKKPK